MDFDFESNYIFNSKDVDGQSLIHAINLLLPQDCVGLEVGVFRAQTFCTILQNCPNIKTLYGIDPYKPYADYIKPIYDGIPSYVVSAKDIEFVKLTALHNIQWSGQKEKVVLYEEDSAEAVVHFEDESLDFIFLDAYMSKEDIKADIERWYPKIKPNGIFSGHDWNMGDVMQTEVLDFRKSNNITSPLSVFDSTWMWIKK